MRAQHTGGRPLSLQGMQAGKFTIPKLGGLGGLAKASSAPSATPSQASNKGRGVPLANYSRQHHLPLAPEASHVQVPGKTQVFKSVTVYMAPDLEEDSPLNTPVT